jgi:hypothetical protein
VAFWNTRPMLLPAGYSGDELVTIGEAARITGVDSKTISMTISQCEAQSGFPALVSGARERPRRYPLGSIVEVLNTGRPGKRGPAARAAA